MRSSFGSRTAVAYSKWPATGLLKTGIACSAHRESLLARCTFYGRILVGEQRSSLARSESQLLMVEQFWGQTCGAPRSSILLRFSRLRALAKESKLRNTDDSAYTAYRIQYILAVGRRGRTLTRLMWGPIIQLHSGRFPRSRKPLPYQLRDARFRTIEKGRFRLESRSNERVDWTRVWVGVEVDVCLTDSDFF